MNDSVLNRTHLHSTLLLSPLHAPKPPLIQNAGKLDWGAAAESLGIPKSRRTQARAAAGLPPSERSPAAVVVEVPEADIVGLMARRSDLARQPVLYLEHPIKVCHGVLGTPRRGPPVDLGARLVCHLHVAGASPLVMHGGSHGEDCV